MNELMCEMCGSNMVTQEGGFYVCQACGTKFPVKEYIAGENYQTFGEESSQELGNLYELARRAREVGDTEFGLKYYSEILIKEPYSWEAQFYVGYFRVFTYDFLDERGINDFCSSTASAVSIVEYLEDVGEKNEAINLFTDEIFGLVESFYEAYLEGLEDLPYDDDDSYAWYINTLLELCNLLNYYGELVENVTDDTYQDAVNSWIYSIDLHTPLYKHIGFLDKWEHDEYIDAYVEKIRQYDPDYEKPKPKKLFGII
ncbi:hypothetical protein [Methanobrevibacter sp.]|uniref:hypothetical protein n=1 Tax=Methanobrevibacter sp. TaxID=66852 RepID=UPI00388F3660